MSINATITSGVIRNYKRLNYEVWYALAEFIDNSTGSFFQHRDELEKTLKAEKQEFFVRIAYDREAKTLRVSDNAFGMSLDVLNRALVHGLPPDDDSGRNEFGMGLKTAASWMGNRWTLRTTALGDPNEYTIEYDVERIASGDMDLRLKSKPIDAKEHFTVLEIFELNKSIVGRTVNKSKDYLRSMYRVDTSSGDLHLYWGDEALDYLSDMDFLKAADGTEFQKTFDFVINSKRVFGWGGILAAGGRPKAGFAIIRRGRVIQGQPSSWRPHQLFGLQEMGSNDLVNQRLVGEIHLDNFGVSQQKDAIAWEGSDEEDLEAKLFEEFAEYRLAANAHRKRGSGGPSAVTTAAALDELAATIASSSFIDNFNLTEVPSSSVVSLSTKHVLDQVSRTAPNKTVMIGNTEVNIFLNSDLSPNDPYYASQLPGDVVLVVINMQHPFVVNYLGNGNELITYMLHVIYDALAEKKCAIRMGEILPDTVKMIKDSFLREKLIED